MMIVTAGEPDVTVYVHAKDPTTGEGKTGLVFNTSGLTARYVRPRTAGAAITLVTQTAGGAHADGGFVAVDGTNAKGLYRLDLLDAVCAVGEPYVIVLCQLAGTIFEPLLILLSPLPDVIEGVVVADGSNAANAFKTDLTGTDAAAYNNTFCLFRSGANAGMVRPVADGGFNPSTDFLTVTAFPAAPSAGDRFLIINQ